MAIALTTIGVKVSYAFETTAGVRPETGYVRIEGIKEVPEMNPEPETLENTTLDNLEYKTYSTGLKDLGGVLAFNANFTQDLFDKWNGTGGVMEQYEVAKAANKAMWLAIDIPSFNKSCFLAVEPTALGVPPASVNAILETPLYVTPIGEPVWATDPVYSTETAYAVTFTVTNIAEEAVAGVSIQIVDGETKVTNASGEAVFQLKTGSYIYVVSKSGITTRYDGLTVATSNVAVAIEDFE